MADRKKRFGISSESEKMQARKEKFGLNTEDQRKEKLAARAKRFGMTQSADPSSLMTDSLKRKRMERFGIVDNDDRVAKRKKRFGMSESKLPSLPGKKNNKQELTEAQKKRQDRFGTGSQISDDIIAKRKA